MARRTKEEALRAGRENPLIGDIAPLQRIYNVLGGIGAELSGGDMGTPFGQRYGERMRQGEAEIRRLQELRAAYPEEFGRGMMLEQERMDPYMLDLGLSAARAMRPGVTTFSRIEGPDRIRQGAAEMPAGGGGGSAPGRIGYAPRPAEPYYRNVPSEMGTSPGPMSAYNQNMYGMSTGRYGPGGARYAPEMAVTDFETYGQGAGRTSPETWGRPISGFDQNMLDAYRRGRMNRMGEGRPTMAGEYTPEEMGSAMVPYRQGGLVYEPVGGQGGVPAMRGGSMPMGQGAPQGGLPMMARGPAARGPMEGEWSEVYGLGGPQMPPRYAGDMNFGVTRAGMAGGAGRGFPYGQAAVAAGAGGAGYLAGLPREQQAALEARRALLPPIDVGMGRATTALSGQAPSSAAAVMQPATGGAQTRGGKVGGAKAAKAGKKGAEQGPPMPQAQLDPNMNYYVTQAIDRLLGGGEAERGLATQQYYATNPWPY